MATSVSISRHDTSRHVTADTSLTLRRRAAKVMSIFLDVYPSLLKTIKPSIAELETYLEGRPPMTELGEYAAAKVLPCVEAEVYRAV